MTFEQRLAVLLGAAITIAATVECVIRGWHTLQRWASRNVDDMVDDGLAILTVTDDDFDEYAHDDWADPGHATPTFRNLCASNPAVVDALAAAEAARADWDEPYEWSHR